MRAALAVLAVLALCAGPVGAQAPAVCADCLRGHIAHLAAPSLRGRLCATEGEASAADYLAHQLKAAGVQAAAPEGGFVQTVALDGVRYMSAPTLKAGGVDLRYGEAFLSFGLLSPLDGRLTRVADAADAPADLRGAVVFYDPRGAGDPGAIEALRSRGVAAVLIVAPASLAPHWNTLADRLPSQRVAGPDDPAAPSGPPLILLRPAAAGALRALPTDTPVKLSVTTMPYAGATHNVVGVIHGSAGDADAHALLLSAHYDHLGVSAGQLYPGANDDASGTAAVLEFARVLAKGPPPRRTVYFALFGCEEEGGYGAAFFRAHPPGGRLEDLAANLEFEMIGFADPKRPGALMLTGWERSNLGPALAAHGAKIGPDLYPEGHFFQRSDNYALAQKGVVAHTISAWPTPPTYHRPTDTYASLDKAFVVEMVGALVAPIRWLADSDFSPTWNPGGKP